MLKPLLKFKTNTSLRLKNEINLALNKYLSPDSLLTGNSRRSQEFISVNAKSKKKSELTFPSSTCTQTHACAYAQTLGLAFRSRRTSLTRGMCRKALQTYSSRANVFLHGCTSQHFQRLHYPQQSTKRILHIWYLWYVVSPVTASAFQAAVTDATVSSRV